MTATSTAANFLSRATALVDRGFSVIPLAPKDKAPAPGLGASSRSSNRNVIEAWSRTWPDANVGLCADENFTLLETDDEQTLRDKIREISGRELPQTLKLGSGRQNRGCWVFRRTPACGDDCLELPGILEFRNRNQYVAAPGSIHPSGLVYRWLEDVPVVEMPSSLMAPLKELDGAYQGRRVSNHQKCGAYAKLKQAYMLNFDPQNMLGIENIEVCEGERHYTLVSLAGVLHDGERGAEDIAEILCEIRDEYFAAGKGDEEIERIAEDIVRKEPHRSFRLFFGGKVVR